MALAPLAALADDLLTLLAAPECAGCGRPGAVLCERCRSVLTPTPRRVEVPAWPDGPPATVCSDYAGVVRVVINAWKERGRHDLEPALGAVLADAVLALPPPDHAVPREDTLPLVPVPSSRGARRRRGADGVRNLAFHAAVVLRASGVRARVVPALALGRVVADQAGLSAAERVRNVAGAFRVRPAAGALLADRDVVVVDDVLTTGATLLSASTAAMAAGARVRGLACVSATPRRRSLSARSPEG